MLQIKRTPLVLLVLFVVSTLTPSFALLCYTCGEYTDGVGSITPCLNYTEKDLKSCSSPTKQSSSCVKYTMDAIVVRGCLSDCQGGEQSWGTVYCCNQDACNGSQHSVISKFVVLLVIIGISILIQSIIL